MMTFKKANYVGKKIQLYPGDTYSKFGIIMDVDDLGWTIKITQSKCDHYKVGEIHFLNHAKSFTFKFIN